MSSLRMDDPIERLFRRIDAIGNVGGIAAPRQPAYAPLPEEEAQSLMDSLLNKSVGGLQWSGETLDKSLGGRAVRGLLGGKPEEALSLIPFSDTLGITDPKNAVSGRDLLDQYGITEQNRDGFHPIDDPMDAVGDVGGFLAEIALDPATYLTFGASALGKGGRALKDAGLLTDDVIKAGVRGRVGNTVGDIVNKLDDVRRTQATDALAETAQRTGATMEQLLADKVGGHVGVGLPFMEPAAVLGTSSDGLSGLVANSLGGIGDAIAQSKPGAFVRSLLDRRVYGAVDPIAQEALAPRVGRIRRAGMDETLRTQQAVQAAPELGDAAYQLSAIAQHTLGDDAADILRNLGVENLPELSPAARDLIEKNVAGDAALHGDVRKMGLVDIGNIEDKYARYRYRPGNKAEFPEGDRADILGGGKRFKMQWDALRPRSRALMDIPGGDVVIDALSKDARFVGPARLKGKDATGELLTQLWGYARTGGEDGFNEFLQQPSLKEVMAAVKQAESRSTAYKAKRGWQQTVAKVAKESGWNPKALERAVRDAAEQASVEATSHNQMWDFLDDSLRSMQFMNKSGTGKYKGLRKAILSAEDEANPQLVRLGFDEWKERVLDSGLVSPQLFEDFGALQEFIRGGRKPITYKKGWTKPTDEMIETVARDDELRDQFNELAKSKLTDEQKAMVADYRKAKSLQQKLATFDPRHVEQGKGIYDRSYLEAQRTSRVHMTGAQQMSAGVHDMFSDAAVKGAEYASNPEYVPMQAALQAVVRSNTANAKAIERMLPAAAQFQSQNLAKKFGDGSIADVFVPAKIVKEAQKVLKTWRTPEEIGNVGKIIDKFTDWFKVGVTAFPAFHTRNLASGQIQNILNGLVSPTEAFPIANMARKVVTGNEAVEGLSKLKAFKGMTDAEATKALRGYITAFDVWGDKFHGNLPTLPDAPPELFPKAGVAPLEPLLMPRKPVSAWQEITGAAKDIAGAGRQSLNPKSPKFAGKRLYEAHGEVGRYIEGLNRISGFLGGLKKGLSPAEAAARVAFTQVDYSHLTNFEKVFLKRAFPFWTFSRGIAENVAKTLVEHPGGRMAQAIRASNSARDTGEFLPDYVGESATIPTGTPGQYITSLGLAHEAPFEWFATTPTLTGTVKRFAQKIGSQMSPYLKLPTETMTGVNLFTGRPQEELYQFPFSGETGIGRMANSVLGNSPLSRWMTTVRKIKDDRKDIAVKTLGLTTGLGITDVSEPERAKELAARRLNEEVLRQSPRIKSRNELYMPQEFRGKETDEEKLMLRLKATLEKKRREATKKKRAEKQVAERAAG